jgi:Amidohydrolase family
MNNRLVIAGGSVDGSAEAIDVAIEDGVVVEIGPELNRAGKVVDASGHYVLPGLVDSHVHVSGHFGRPVGFAMLVRGGVVAALDLAGDPTDLAATLPEQGCGLTVGVLFPLIPGDTVSSATPQRAEIENVLETQLDRGALGLKVLGGHFPLTPESTSEVIKICAERSVYCAVHAGSTETGSDVTGVEELVTLADGRPVHVAHVNSYCRGQIEDPVAEATRALSAIGSSSACWSESYLSLLNGADARCRDGVPASGVVRTCLRLGGFEETEVGLEAAIRSEWGRVQGEVDGGIGYLEPEAGLALFRERGTEVGIGFPVNPPASSLALALARAPDRSFVIDAFASDGGSIPRNTILEQGIALVHAGLLPLADLVHKACHEPAERLGLDGKGQLAPGAGGDVIVVAKNGSCRDVVIAGEVVMRDRAVVRSDGGRMLRPG